LAWLLRDGKLGRMETQNGWNRLTPAQKVIAEGAGCVACLAIIWSADALSQPLGPMLVNFLHGLAASLH